MAKLTLAVSASGGLGYDFTTLGSADWLAYTDSGSPLSKANATALAIAQLSGSPGAVGYARSTGPTFNYTDGTAPTSGSTQGGFYIISSGPSNGWSITAPADTTERRLRVYGGIYAGSGIKVTATLSDGSAAQAVDTSFVYVSGPDPRTAEYLIDYSAASAGQTLTVQIQPVSTGTLSLQGAALGTAPVIAAPGAPTIGTAVGGSKSASVGGTAPASNGGSAVTGYRVTSSPGGVTATSTGLPVSVAGLTDGVAYTFTLAAQNEVGYGPESAASNSVTPSSANNAPTFTGTIPAIGGQAGTAITPVDMRGYFQDTDALTYSASPSGTAWPDGLSIAAATGIISGTIAAIGTTTGIRVRATDTASQSVNSNAFNVVMSSGPTQVAYNDAAIVFSPYGWDDRGTYKSANAPGAYAKLDFTGTSVTAKFDISAFSAASVAGGSYPIVRTVIDGKFVTDTQLSSGSPNVAVTGLSSGAHTLEMYFRAVDVNIGDRWTTPLSALRLMGFTLDTGATFSAPAVRSKSMIFFGDSITEGYIVNGAANPGGNSAVHTVVPFIAQGLGCEYGQIGYSAQGYEKTGNGNVPALNAAIPLYSAGRSRLVNGKFSPEPDYVCVMHGANGTPTSAGIQTVITTLRAAAPNARIFLMVPAGGYARAAITAAALAKNSDTKLHVIDLGAEYQPGMDSSGNGGQYSNDNGLHPNFPGNAKAATGYLPKMQAVIDGAAVIEPQPALTPRTVSLTLASGKDASGNLIPAAGISGLRVSFHDEPSPNVTTVPRYQSASETTDSAGVLTFVVNSTLASGGTGHLTVLGAAGVHFNGSVQVT